MRLSFNKKSFISLVCAVTPLLGAQTLAQTPTPNTSTAEEQIVQLDAYNVTGLREKGFVPKNSAAGTKTIIPLLEAPQSISVITADQMAIQGAQGVDDAVKYSAGVIGNPYGFDPRTDWLYVRGFKPTRYIDGLAMPDGVWTGVTRLEPYGFERVEVLKGASSALYGPMPVGGLVNASTKRPTFERLGEVSVSYGSFNQLHAALDIGGPLTSNASASANTGSTSSVSNNTVLYRLTATFRDGETVLDHSKDDRVFIAPALTWIITPDTFITLLARYQHDDNRGLLGFLPADGTIYANPNGKLPISLYTGEPDFDYYKKNLWSLGYEIEHRFGTERNWRVRQNLRYVNADVDQALVGTLALQSDMRTVGRYTWTPQEKTDGVAIDTQLGGTFNINSPSGQHRATNEILVGVDYLHTETNAKSGMDFGTPALDLYAPVYGAPITRPANGTFLDQRQDQVGLYAQDRVTFGRFILTLGVRQDFVDIDSDNHSGAPTENKSDNKLSTRVGLTYKLDNGLAPYAAWSTSFQPNLGAAYDGTTFAPTTGKLFELGLKYQPRNLRSIDALFTLAAYQSELKNILTNDASAPVFGYSVQQGKTRVRGLEAEARVTPLRGLSLSAAYTYTDTEIRATSVTTDLGKQLPLVPKNRATLWAFYTFENGPLKNLGFGAGASYNSAVYGDSANLFKGNSATLFDAVVRYDLCNWRFQINATNLLDKRYVSAVQNTLWAFYGSPRNVTASVAYRF